MNLKKLRERKNALILRAEEIMNKAKDEDRELTDEEITEAEGIKKDVERINTTIELNEQIQNLDTTEKKEDGEPVEEKETTEKDVEEAETRAFETFLRGTVINNRDVAPNNLDVGDNGAIIPSTIANKVIRRVYDVCPILAQSTQYNVRGTLTIPYYDDSTTSIMVAYQDEFVEMTSHVGKFTTTITLTGYLAGALSKISRSLINNSQFDIVTYVINDMAQEIARFIERELLHGTENKVAGLSTISNTVTADAANAITADDIVKLHDKIKDVYQNNAMWIMSSQTRTALRLLKDENGRYLLQDDVTSPFGTRLLGKPVHVSDNMPNIEAGKAVIYYGDFSGLATKFNETINVQVLQEKFADQHAVGVISWFEFDAKIEDGQKIAQLKMAAE